MNAGAE